jgi:hypothetical protein
MIHREAAIVSQYGTRREAAGQILPFSVIVVDKGKSSRTNYVIPHNISTDGTK